MTGSCLSRTSGLPEAAIVREPWFLLRPHILPLWERHHAEIGDPADRGRIALSPHWARYDARDAEGALHIMTMRQAGALIGYVFVIVDVHLHYRETLCGFFDLYWVDPEYRGHWAGVRLMRETEASLKARGIKKLFSGTKLWHDASAMFKRCGWAETERLHTKWIGG